NKKLTRLLLVTLEDPYNPRSWSGIPYNMRIALETKVNNLSVVSNLKPRRTPVNVLLRVVCGGKKPRYPLYLTRAAQKQFAREVEAAIEKHRPDAILSISSHCLLYLNNPGIPTYMFTDAPWLAWKESYKPFDPSMPILGGRFAALEAKTAKRCTGLVYPSEWAASEAQKLYDVSSDKIHVQRMGANWYPSLTGDELKAVIQARPADRLDLLYVGKDWERKGGPLTLEVVRGLKNANVKNLCLHIVGCAPEVPSDIQDVVKIHGLLKVDDPQSGEKLRKLFLDSHFLIVPTRAECFGLVFAEAYAFGLPPISRAVDAVPSIIEDGKTGILEDRHASAERYIERIIALAKNRNAYLNMAFAARGRYEETFNWDKFADGVTYIIDQQLEAFQAATPVSQSAH
ncbi:MAG TPA: glycosyltransferase family 4 protein, partial [Pseudacidobacterium sp.]|nr:glycosyltransferase family 4 protein [Pseudacidobacterium sp.]